MYPSSVNVFKGAFHYTKDPGNFGRKSNGKVRFGFFRPEYAGSPLEMVLTFRVEYPDRITVFFVVGAYNLLRVTDVPFVAILQQTYPNY